MSLSSAPNKAPDDADNPPSRNTFTNNPAAQTGRPHPQTPPTTAVAAAAAASPASSRRSSASSFLFTSSSSSHQSDAFAGAARRLAGASHLHLPEAVSNATPDTKRRASPSPSSAPAREKRNTIDSITVSVSDRDLERQMKTQDYFKTTTEEEPAIPPLPSAPHEKNKHTPENGENIDVTVLASLSPDSQPPSTSSSGSAPDDGAAYSRWSNKDLLPVPSEKRTYTAMSYIWFWMVAGSSVITWSIGGSLLDSGLSARLAMACIVVGSIIVGILSFLCGWIGRMYHIGFTMAARTEYGMYGSFLLIVLRLFVLIIWFSIQAYWGGQATRVLLGAIIPGFVNGSLSGLISQSSHLQKNDLISIFIFLFFYVLLVVFVPPERMQFPFALSFLAFLGTMIGVLSWAMAETHGKIGPLFYSTRNTSRLSTGWMVMQGITSVVGTWSGGSLSHSDWTRFAKHPHSPLLSQFIFAPVVIVVTSFIGIVVTSASGLVFDIAPEAPHPWNPIDLLAQIQAYYNDSSRARAGVFFASLGIVSSQIFIATVLNSISAALDMSALLPRYINLRRGALLMAAIAVLVQPWQLSNNSGIFLVVLGGFGIFMVSGVGITIGNFFFRLRKHISLSDLYRGDSSSIYWHTHGVSIIGIFSFVLGFVFLIPGWVFTIKNAQRARAIAEGESDYRAEPYDNGWMRIYSLSALLGAVISGGSVVLLSYAKTMIRKNQDRRKVHPFTQRS